MINNIIDFGQLGGYRLEQPTFEKMQSTYFGILNALLGHLGVPNTGNFIVSGCEISGANITPGIMYIGGALCPFAGGVGTSTTKIKKRVTTSTLSFQNGTSPAVFTATDAIIDAAGVELNLYTRIPNINNIPWANIIDKPSGLVIDGTYVHTDENFTALLLAKLNGIQDFAEVNVQSDFLQTDITADDYIKNLPPGFLQTYLKKGRILIGDLIGDTQSFTISLGVDVGTDDYHVSGCLIGKYPTTDNTEVKANWIVKRKTNVSFDIVITDYSNDHSQNFEFDYIILSM